MTDTQAGLLPAKIMDALLRNLTVRHGHQIWGKEEAVAAIMAEIEAAQPSPPASAEVSVLGSQSELYAAVCAVKQHFTDEMLEKIPVLDRGRLDLALAHHIRAWNNRQASGAAVQVPEGLAQLRADGWMVAIHNDYVLNGRRMTFWGFTREAQWIKGEGATDEEAIAQAMLAAAPQKQGA